MFGVSPRRWPVLTILLAGGAIVGAGGMGAYRLALAEPAVDPIALPLPVPDASPVEPVIPAAGIVPPNPAVLTPRPGDLLPVPELPKPLPNTPSVPAIPTDDVPKVPELRVIELPKPKSATKAPESNAIQVPVLTPEPGSEAKPAVDVAPAPRPVAPELKLPEVELPPPAVEVPTLPEVKPAEIPAKSPSPPAKPRPVDLPTIDASVLPVPGEVPQAAPPAKSAQSPMIGTADTAGKPLQTPDLRHSVNSKGAPLEKTELPAVPRADTLVPVAPAPREVSREPVPARLTTHPGDTSMALNFRQLTQAAVLSTAFAALPALAEEPAKPQLPADAVKQADLDPLKRQIDELRKDVRDLKDTIYGKSDLGGLANDGLTQSVRRLQTMLESIDKKLQSLENKMLDSSRTAGSSPLGNNPPAPIAAATRGTVKIVNEYPVEISMLINSVPYRVAPNSTLDVTVPAGTLKYQLLTSGAAETSSPVKDGETVTLRVR